LLRKGSQGVKTEGGRSGRYGVKKGSKGDRHKEPTSGEEGGGEEFAKGKDGHMREGPERF